MSSRWQILPYGIDITDEPDKTNFKSLAGKITVVGEKKIEIEFECGIKIKESIT